jgi:hypothetical protein
VRTFASGLPKDIAVVADVDGKIGHTFLMATTPYTVLLREDGTVVAKAAPTMREGFEFLMEEHLFRNGAGSSPSTDVRARMRSGPVTHTHVHGA